MDLATIEAAYSSLKAGKEILGTIVDTKIQTESLAKITDVLSKLGQAQDTLFYLREELFKLQAENETLRQQLITQNKWEARMADYSLCKTAGGAVIFESKREPKHYLRPSCLNKQEIHILQDNRALSGTFQCTGCASEYPVNSRQPTPKINRSIRDIV